MLTVRSAPLVPVPDVTRAIACKHASYSFTASCIPNATAGRNEGLLMHSNCHAGGNADINGSHQHKWAAGDG